MEEWNSERQCLACKATLPTNAHGRYCAACWFALGLSEPALPLEVKCHRVGDYELLEELGRGGMGVVFKAFQISLNRVVALKFLHPIWLVYPEAVIRFRREAEAAARLSHPNIVPVYESGEYQKSLFLVMKFIDGVTLADRLFRRTGDLGLVCGPENGKHSTSYDRGLPARRRLDVDLISTIARAVHFAHQHGIVHRDLKPGNILLDSEGRPHVVDLGVASVRAAGGSVERSSFTQPATVLGTPVYMAPEQALGQRAEASADIYSLGVMLYEMLTAKKPFEASDFQRVIHLHINAPVPRLASELAKWQDLLDLMLAKLPPARPADGAALLACLRNFS